MAKFIKGKDGGYFDYSPEEIAQMARDAATRPAHPITIVLHQKHRDLVLPDWMKTNPALKFVDTFKKPRGPTATKAIVRFATRLAHWLVTAEGFSQKEAAHLAAEYVKKQYGYNEKRKNRKTGKVKRHPLGVTIYNKLRRGRV
jgi:hypothetical protein